jgi:hypothetical protein
VAALPIPTWKERLAACFRFRHRLLHVVGVPTALGAVSAVGTASMLGSDPALALGALVAGVGSLIAGYYVTAGFDRGLVERLQAEKAEAGEREEALDIERTLLNAHPEIKPILGRIIATHASIDAVFADGIDDPVERILAGSRGDLRALRDRAAKMVELYRRLNDVIHQSDGPRLYEEMNRLRERLGRTPEGPGRRAQEEAFASAERTYGQWRAAVDRRDQVTSVLTVIDKNLEEFKLAMALRKADVIEGIDSEANVSELQARLSAAGEACDELVGRATAEPRRARRSRA